MLMEQFEAAWGKDYATEAAVTDSDISANGSAVPDIIGIGCSHVLAKRAIRTCKKAGCVYSHNHLHIIEATKMHLTMEVKFMDINCTHLCFYQQEGKCTLRELPAYTSNTYTPYSNDTDCPYFAESYTVETPSNTVS